MNNNTNEKLKLVPKKPGVYIMKNEDGRVIYVGKAKALYNRLAQYFIGTPKDKKTMLMVMSVADFDYIITASEKDALILEDNLIKKHKPKYNILLKDDKTFPFLKCELKDQYPYFTLVRKTFRDSNKYYGPFMNGWLVHEIIDTVTKEYKIRSCRANLDKPKKRACVNFHIGYCSAPCVRNISQADYHKTVSAANQSLDKGLKNLIPKLNEQMNDFSQSMDFENAAKVRDRLKIIKEFAERQQVVSLKHVSLDAVYIYREGELTAVAVIEVRDGIINDKKAYTFTESDQIGDFEILSSFLEQYYIIKDNTINCIVMGCNFDFFNLQNSEKYFTELSENLSELKNKKTVISKGRGRFSKGMLKMAEENAREAIKLRLETKIDDLLFKLKEKLKLYSAPMRIESYDISNTAGSDAVGVMTVFENGVLTQKEKRKFAIRGINGSDDYASIFEVINRRASNLDEALKNNISNGFENIPDLIFIDGGKGQLKMAKKALDNYGFDIPVFGLVKDDKHRTRDVVDLYNSYNIKEDRQLFTFVSKIQEETHKNAITYHKQRSTLSGTKSELLAVPNVGKASLQKLFDNFKTISKMKEASLEQLKEILPAKTAESIHEYFHTII